MAKWGLFPAPVARRIYLNAGGGSGREIREFSRPPGGGGGGNELFVAELNEDWSAGVAECSIYSMNGTSLSDTGEDEDVFDPLQAFVVLGVGDRLYVTKQGDKYYAANNAPCPGSGES